METESHRQIPRTCNGNVVATSTNTFQDDKRCEDNVNHDHMLCGKPPRASMRHCSSSASLRAQEAETQSPPGSTSIEQAAYQPVFRSGSFSDKGPKQNMEDEHICVDDLSQHVSKRGAEHPTPGAFYGAFDGHGGRDAALFTRENILEYIVKDSEFWTETKKVVKRAFAKVDHALADAQSVDRSSGTTVLTAIILGRTMVIANAGDSRAVLGRRGRAIDLSKDHKPNSESERARIERMGGVIHDGYLNGQLAVARALGDWEMKGPKGSKSPLSADPELKEITLTEEDEFLIIGSDGVWDVMSSQCAVTMARKELMLHNDPSRCSQALINEVLQRNTCDNVTLLVVCFSPSPPPKICCPTSHKRRSISAEGLDRLKGLLA